MSTTDAVHAVFSIESARIIARVARIVRDVGVAEELAQDALVAALEHWPQRGVPHNPAAWLMATARRRAIDVVRRQKRLSEKQRVLGAELEVAPADDWDAAIDDDIGDDMLRLIFVACHPVLSVQARVALTLRLLGGLTTAEIARAFLVSEPTVAQRIVRAKRTLSEAGVPFEIPPAKERAERLESVLEVLYLIFNEGYTATSGKDWIRPALCEDALRLGRILAELTPNESEVHGLVALMEIQASRLSARVGPRGEPIRLLDQNRGRWDHGLIRRGLTALERSGGRPGPYALQAAIAACHARARTAEETDWALIATLYATLAHVMPSPVVELNRAVAVGMASGAQQGLDLVDQLRAEPGMERYHLLAAVRGDMLVRLNRYNDAAAEFERAATMTQNETEQAMMQDRARECRSIDAKKSRPT